jgi:hypothetical protein
VGKRFQGVCVKHWSAFAFRHAWVKLFGKAVQSYEEIVIKQNKTEKKLAFSEFMRTFAP